MPTHFQFSLFLLLCGFTTVGQTQKPDKYWLLFADSVNDTYGYKNLKGQIVIQPGKYNFCFTDTFYTYAIVSKQNAGFVAIDRRQNVLYNVFPFDNGPDYIAEGTFRVIKDNKIGYANAATGKIIIDPQFSCAFPFDNGMAKVSINCTTKASGEHKVWLSNNWFYINKTGKKIPGKMK